MKRFALILLLFIFNIVGETQNLITDSLWKILLKEKSDTGKAIILYKLSYYYQIYKPDSALLIAQSAYTLSKKYKFLKGELNSLGQMGSAFNRLGNFPKALEYYIEQLKILEKDRSKENLQERLATVYMNIATVYNSKKEAANALFYAYKGDSIVKIILRSDTALTYLPLYTTLNIGDIYLNNNQLDSALLYTRLCYNLAVKQKNNIITGTALNNIGTINFKLEKFMEALSSYKKSIPYLIAVQDYNTLSECDLGLAKVYDKLGKPDSALYFAKASFQRSSGNQFLKHALNASAFISQLYKQQHRVDSAFAYQETYLTLKDSYDNSEKIKQLQSITISEQLRQQQIEELKIENLKERKVKLQLLLIGMLIPVFFFISTLISRKKVHKKIIELTGVFSLLFLFEYIILLLNPIVAKATNHTPIYEILIFVAIAAILTPAHHKIEQWLITQLTHKHHNKPDVILKESKRIKRNG